MSLFRVRRLRDKCWLPILLAAVAGFIDGVGFLVLFGMFTSHMSGNSVFLGVNLGLSRWAAAGHHAFPILLFVIGVGLGAASNEALLRRGVRSRLAVTLGLETLLLLAFLIGGEPVLRDGALRPDSTIVFYLLAALPALAMGFQNAVLRRAGTVTSRTTFITGSLTSCAEDAVTYMYWLLDHNRGPRRRRLSVLLRISVRRPHFTNMALLLGLWAGYVASAVLGAYMLGEWGLPCLLLPIGGLAALIVVDAVRPLSVSGK